MNRLDRFQAGDRRKAEQAEMSTEELLERLARKVEQDDRLFDLLAD